MVNSNKKQIYIFIGIILFMIIIILIYFFKSNFLNSDYDIIESSNILENTYSSNTDSSNEINNKANDIDTIENDDYIIVHITGAINNPGIVKLPIGSRISDAISSAGGFTSDSDISAINLAYKLDDGQKIYIPYISDNPVSDNFITSSPGENIVVEENSYSMNSNSNLVNINTATQTELETIPGIGPSTALKIIEYRNQNGKFKSIEDIKNISGIGDSKFDNIKLYIKIK